MSSGLVALFVKLPVLLTEFVDATSGVHKLRFARVKGVTHVTHLHLDQRVLVAIFPLDGFLGFSCGFAQKRIFVAHVLEYNQTVVVGMDAFFHLFQFWEGEGTKTPKDFRKHAH